MSLFLVGSLATVVASHAADQPKPVDFDRDIRPIFSENCYPCHGPDENKRKAGLRFDRKEGAFVKLKSGTFAIVPGNLEQSALVQRITTTNADDRMPPLDSTKKLSASQTELLQRWVRDGAKWELHWSFVAPRRPPLPNVIDKKWAHNEIDAFVLARLEREGLHPSPPAPRETLLRRLSLDLSGLPPTPAQLKDWSSHRDPVRAAVDELLASPHFGERMASDWLDVARYADTHGFNNDSLRSMWRWRDWVIQAFNQNLPYDRFITDQLAGDLEKNPTLDQEIATGFNRNHGINSEGGIIDEEYRVSYVNDRVRTTTMAWLGLTMECARCHDHKFDPITQQDYYKFFAFFNNIDEFGEDGRVANASPLIKAPTEEQQKDITTLRRRIETAREKMNSIAAKQSWRDARFEALAKTEPSTNAIAATNMIISFDLRPRGISRDDSRVDPPSRPLTLPSPPVGERVAEGRVRGTSAASSGAGAILGEAPIKQLTNSGGGKPFEAIGTITTAGGPLAQPALVFDGKSELKTSALPNHSGKGWVFSAWVRRDKDEAAALFSTANFSIPESSGDFGKGVQILLTVSGAIEVRSAVRWPAYSANIVTDETLPRGEWQHVAVVWDGSTRSAGFHVFLNGEECFSRVIHDDLSGGVGINGAARIGISGEKAANHFMGALASIQVLPNADHLKDRVAQWRNDVLRYDIETTSTARTERQNYRLHRAWLETNNPQFAQAATEDRDARAALLKLEASVPDTMVMRELTDRRLTHVLFRGEYDKPRDEVQPDVPSFLPPLGKGTPRNRLGLAQWLTDPRNPLTARVVVNRFWQNLFGHGIVKTSGDFGYQGDSPVNPELLDWLATRFVASGWNVKELIRLMATSATYAQSSDSTPELNDRDPDNLLLARGPRRRLTAEMLRDQALCVSGLLYDKIGGPPVYPYQPKNLYKGIVVAADYPGTSYTESNGKDLYRRSLYTFWKRTVPYPTLSIFDVPDREVCVVQRPNTDTPLQALALMNDPVQLEAARKLAERMLLEGGKNPAQRLGFAFVLATARRPRADESRPLEKLLEQRLAAYRADPDAAKAFIAVGESKPDASLDPVELAAYANLASLILNLDETITRN